MIKSIHPKMKQFLIPIFLCIGVLSFAFALPAGPATVESRAENITAPAVVEKPFDATSLLYESLQLDSLQLTREAFDFAIKGYQTLLAQGEIQKQNLVSIVDFSLPSSKKRMFVIDIENGKLLFNTYVSHGRNSGLENATHFSNGMNSFQSSLGFYVTQKAYKGEHGYSLRLEGKEKGINDNAYDRGIVIHSARYVNEKLISKLGYIGRSLGCPAIPVKVHKAIIEKIKDGSCLFVYGADKSYASGSSLLSSIATT